MDTRDTNRVNMFKTTADYLDKRNSVWGTMAPLADAQTRFRAAIVAIDTAAQKQGTASGATSEKEAARTALEDAAFLMSRALSVLGHTSGDHELKARATSARSDWDRLVDEEVSNRAATVLEDANAHKTDLGRLNMTQAKIDDLTVKLDRFNSARTSPRTAVADRAAQTQSLRPLMRDANSILQNELDPMVDLFEETDPEFVRGYQVARVIVDRRGSRRTAAAPGGGTPPATPQ